MLKEKLQNATNWQERFRLLIQASKNLPIPSEQEREEMEEIHGCEARLWWQMEKNATGLQFKAYSEARIMNGILFLLLEELNGMPLSAIKTFSLDSFFEKNGILQNLSQTRRLGLKEIEKRLQQAEYC
ncbi:SufE family protein [Actinobacillus delphinicola]|uniref:Fe-S metabolism associated SufE n=1 Tax=Actinobacillus delphinicola TaxID=51161 RepID=A0A448TTX9_9PAST|nr:SufE family protein [Actinobacillus delphinicola]VEJ09454.1 Fe-S metabolism associated SufE [Actinobacillus delphinicola]